MNYFLSKMKGVYGNINILFSCRKFSPFDGNVYLNDAIFATLCGFSAK
jgi:hypothetical protein